MALKPIIHGNVDPTEVPYYCRKCKFYVNNTNDFPRCSKREDGKFRPLTGFDCYRVRLEDSK